MQSGRLPRRDSARGNPPTRLPLLQRRSIKKCRGAACCALSAIRVGQGKPCPYNSQERVFRHPLAKGAGGISAGKPPEPRPVLNAGRLPAPRIPGHPCLQSSRYAKRESGEMAEWSKAADSKSVVPLYRGTGGSNPSLSAISFSFSLLSTRLCFGTIALSQVQSLFLPTYR